MCDSACSSGLFRTVMKDGWRALFLAPLFMRGVLAALLAELF